MTTTVEELKSDYNWRAAFHEAIHGESSKYEHTDPILKSVDQVIAASEGEHDGLEWICVCHLADGRYCVMRAGCDYTGWDCQAGGKIEYYATAEEAVSKITLTAEEIVRLRDDIIASGINIDWGTP